MQSSSTPRAPLSSNRRARLNQIPARPLLSLALALSGLVGACVCPPQAEAVLPLATEGTTRTPEQTFRTFRLAFLLDQGLLEYDCLSRSLIASNGISALAYLEFRDALVEQEPFLRYGLSKATEVETFVISPWEALVSCSLKGRKLVLRMVREDFRERYEDGRWASDADLEDWHDWDAANSKVLSTEAGKHYLVAYFPIDDPEAAAKTSEIRMGSEWKIDGFLVDGVEIRPGGLQP